MAAPLKPAQLDWSTGLPFAKEFSDIYFSIAGGDAETRHVFLEGNQLPTRFNQLGNNQPFTIAETGFGTGLNWLCTQALWQECGRKGWLHYVSIEKHPLELANLIRAQSIWPAFSDFSCHLQAHYPPLVSGFHRLFFPALRSTLTLVFADVHEALEHIHATVDAWFLDGFAPAKNPAMWEAPLYTQMARLSNTNATFATFTAAGHVRRHLQEAGFTVEKVKGFGNKREMLRGFFSQEKNETAPHPKKPWFYRPQPKPPAQQALVIGAGIAGASTAQALAERGWRVTVLEKTTIAHGASGNPAAGVSVTAASANDNPLAHFQQQASLHTLRTLHTLKNSDSGCEHWHPCGLLSLPNQHHKKGFAGDKEIGLPADYWQAVDAETASQLAGIPVASRAVWQSRSGWLSARAWCQQLLDHPLITVHENTAVRHLYKQQENWLIEADDSRTYSAPIVIVATGFETEALLPSLQDDTRKVRGQIAKVPASDYSRQLKTIIGGEGYISPIFNGVQHSLGASFVPDDDNADIRFDEFLAMRQFITQALPELDNTLPDCATWEGRSAIRYQSRDYLPLLGPVPEYAVLPEHYAGLRHGRLQDYPLLLIQTGLYLNVGHGSHGFVHACLAAEILASELNNEPAPCSRQVLDSLHPARFAIRRIKR